MSYFIIAFINAMAFTGTRHLMAPNQLITMRPQMMANPMINNIFGIALFVHVVLYPIIIIYGVILLGWYIALPVSLLALLLGPFISFKLGPGLTAIIFGVSSIPAYLSLLFIW